MARQKKGDKFLNAKLPVNVIEKVNAYSEATRIPKTAIVEMALNEYLNKVAPVKSSKKSR